MPDLQHKHPLDEAQLAALIGPRTREVFEVFSTHGPLTGAEVQQFLSFPSKAVYYQIKKLLSVGLLVEEEAREKRATTFKPIAAGVYLPDGFHGARYEKLAAKAASARLRKAMRAFQTAAEKAPEDPSLVDDLLFHFRSMRLTPSELKEMQNRVRAVLAEYLDREPNEESRPVCALFVTTPNFDGQEPPR